MLGVNNVQMKRCEDFDSCVPQDKSCGNHVCFFLGKMHGLVTQKIFSPQVRAYSNKMDKHDYRGFKTAERNYRYPHIGYISTSFHRAHKHLGLLVSFKRKQRIKSNFRNNEIHFR